MSFRVSRFRLFLPLLWLAILWPSDALSQVACFDIFAQSKTSLATDSLATLEADPFEFLYQTLRANKVDATAAVHQVILRVAREPLLQERVTAEIDRLRGVENPLTEKAMYLLRLIDNKDLSLWKSILVSPKALHEMALLNTYGTMGYLIDLMPPSQKQELLDFMSGVYKYEKNRGVVQPIHLILNPKAIYDSMKKEGKSDRDFYFHYLQVLRERVFLGQQTGAYSPELVLQIVKLIQQRIVSDQHPVINFFGSVPNGFGKPGSDLDVFNSINIFKKERENMELTELELMQFSSNLESRQITTPEFNSAIKRLLSGTPWIWEAESRSRVSVEEHFGGEQHVFVFQISADKVVLRFYYRQLHLTEAGEPVPFHYLELDPGPL